MKEAMMASIAVLGKGMKGEMLTSVRGLSYTIVSMISLCLTDSHVLLLFSTSAISSQYTLQ